MVNKYEMAYISESIHITTHNKIKKCKQKESEEKHYGIYS